MKKNKLSRILAIAGLVIIALLIINLIVSAFTGKNFFLSLILLFMVSVLIWALLFFSGKYAEDDQAAKDEYDRKHSKKDQGSAH